MVCESARLCTELQQREVTQERAAAFGQGGLANGELLKHDDRGDELIPGRRRALPVRRCALMGGGDQIAAWTSGQVAENGGLHIGSSRHVTKLASAHENATRRAEPREQCRRTLKLRCGRFTKASEASSQSLG